MTTERRRANPEKLIKFGSLAFQKVGVPKADADITSHIIVQADLRGIDSHGVGHLYSFYVKGIQSGRINPRCAVKVNKGSPTTAVVDGDAGLGFIGGYRAMEAAMDMAQEYGSGWVSVRNSNHFGAGGFYAMMALDRKMIGFSFTVGGNIVAMPGSKGRPVGANVIAIAAPGNKSGPMVLDMATSVVAGGKFEIANREEKPTPPSWGVDKSGKPITDPRVFNTDPGAILPLGGTVEAGAYKGFGLAMFVDVLCGVLSGTGGSLLRYDKRTSHAFGALRIDAFPSGRDFGDQIDAMIEQIHAQPVWPGQKPVMYPGERENLMAAERGKNGIPLHPKIVAELEEMSDTLGLDMDIWM